MIWPAACGRELLTPTASGRGAAGGDDHRRFASSACRRFREVPEPLRGVPVVDVTGAYDGRPGRGRAPGGRAALGGAADDGHLRDHPGSRPLPHQRRSRAAHSGDDPPDHAARAERGSGGRPRRRGRPGSGSPLLAVSLRHLGGALASAPDGAGALATLEGEYAMYGVGVPMAPEMAGADRGHLDRVIDAVEPWSTGRDYLNLAERPGDASRRSRPSTYARLRRGQGRGGPRRHVPGQPPRALSVHRPARSAGVREVTGIVAASRTALPEAPAISPIVS